jgi:hypothetical protein
LKRYRRESRSAVIGWSTCMTKVSSTSIHLARQTLTGNQILRIATRSSSNSWRQTQHCTCTSRRPKNGWST